MNENPENHEVTDPEASDALDGCPRTEPGPGTAPGAAAGSPPDQPATPNIHTTPQAPASHTTYGGQWAPGPPAAGSPNLGPPLADSPWPHSQYGPPAQAPGHQPGGFAGPPSHGQGNWAPPSWPPPGAGQWTASPAHQPPDRKRGMLATALVLSLAVTALLGALVGHAVWSTTTSSAGVQNTALPFHYGSSNPSSSGGSTTPSSSGGSASAAAIASKVDPGLVDVNTTLSYEQVQGAGTGMVLTSNGVVLTNNHVVEGETSISVTDIGNGKTYGATVVGYDRSLDVAVLQLTDASGLSTVTLASSGVSAGESVVAIGNAGGKGGTPSYAAGTITATNQSITASDEATGASEQLTGLIETDHEHRGRRLRRSTRQQFRTGSRNGHSCSSGIPVPVAGQSGLRDSREQGRDDGPPAPGRLFFEHAARRSDSISRGVRRVCARQWNRDVGCTDSHRRLGRPCGDAGLVVGDTITSLDGSSVSSPESLTTVMLSQKPGNTVQVAYIDSSGQQHTVSVQLGNGPPQ